MDHKGVYIVSSTAAIVHFALFICTHTAEDNKGKEKQLARHVGRRSKKRLLIIWR